MKAADRELAAFPGNVSNPGVGLCGRYAYQIDLNAMSGEASFSKIRFIRLFSDSCGSMGEAVG